MDAEQPNLVVPHGFKKYTDNPKENIKLKRKGYSGKKVFRVALVAIDQGNFLFDPVLLNYFDVDVKTYKTISTKPFSIKEYLNSYRRV